MSKKKAAIPFEAALTDLETIVKKLESPNLTLDEALKLFEQGIGLSRYCQNYLETAQQRVEQVITQHEGEICFKPLNVVEEAL